MLTPKTNPIIIIIGGKKIFSKFNPSQKKINPNTHTFIHQTPNQFNKFQKKKKIQFSSSFNDDIITDDYSDEYPFIIYGSIDR